MNMDSPTKSTLDKDIKKDLIYDYSMDLKTQVRWMALSAPVSAAVRCFKARYLYGVQ